MTGGGGVRGVRGAAITHREAAAIWTWSLFRVCSTSTTSGYSSIVRPALSTTLPVLGEERVRAREEGEGVEGEEGISTRRTSEGRC